MTRNQVPVPRPEPAVPADAGYLPVPAADTLPAAQPGSITGAPRSGSRGRLPHPLPYQGSKRLLAPRILAPVAGQRFRRLYEPFAGSAAVTIAAAHAGLAGGYVIGDSLAPLAALWQQTLASPQRLAAAYAAIWQGQAGDPAGHYARVRDAFNRDGDPAKLLYLLARCVKNAPRFNRAGAFNQSPDHRRRGMHPARMRRELLGASALLRGRAVARGAEVDVALADAGPADLVYLDPPYEGTSTGRDRRYHRGFERARLIELVAGLHRRGVPVLLSYDGRSGATTYGPPLPETLHLVRFELAAGRSSQATLLRRADLTVESLYVSRSLVEHRETPGAALETVE